MNRMGIRIKKLREEKNWTQEELGAKIGVQKSAVAKYEKGHTGSMKRSTIETLSKLFEVSPSYLMDLDDLENIHSAARPSNFFNIPSDRIPLIDSDFKVVAANDLVADFCIRIDGDSMIGARINPGDIIFVRKQVTVEDGEIAAILFGNKICFRRIFKIPGRIQFRAENTSYKPEDYTEKEILDKGIKILGKAIAFQSLII